MQPSKTADAQDHNPVCLFYFIYLFIQCFMRVAQLAINNYSTLWPSKHNTSIYICTKTTTLNNKHVSSNHILKTDSNFNVVT